MIKSKTGISQQASFLLKGCVLACLLFFYAVSAMGDSPQQTGSSASEGVRLGERIYREGILPSGKPMQAIIKGDISVPSTSFSCVSCHLRSGLGSFEGGVITPPTDGNSLYQPFNLLYKRVAADKKYFPPIQDRPAYTDESLAAALRSGVDPAGQEMNAVMPRYHLEDDDMALLVSYLKTLSAQPPPGISSTTFSFATVITDDVRPEEYEAMLAPLDYYIRHKNNMADSYKKSKRSERMAAGMLESAELMYKKITLSRWMLKGSPDTWRTQLEEYYRKEPVFALLGGISNSDWKPVHDFCEDHHLPALFPQTNFPVITDSDWYTLYLSKGYYQEGEAAARYLNNNLLPQDGKVLQLVRASREGQALATGFKETWRELGHAAAVSVSLDQAGPISAESLQKLLLKEQPAAIVIWDGTGALQTLELLASIKARPDLVFVASGYLGTGLWSIPESSRDFTYITYPYRLPTAEERYSYYIAPFKKGSTPGDTDTILKRSYTTTAMLTVALMEMRGKYFRDNFFDVIGMSKDQDLPLYERLSFGPGQRYASKGCYIVQLGKGPKPELVKKSSWVTH